MIYISLRTERVLERRQREGGKETFDREKASRGNRVEVGDGKF